jgi:hypothetical protein
LAAANAQVDDAALETVAAHRVDKAGGQHCARRADRMAMRNGATLDIDDILRQTELARYGRNAIAVRVGYLFLDFRAGVRSRGFAALRCGFYSEVNFFTPARVRSFDYRGSSEHRIGFRDASLEVRNPSRDQPSSALCRHSIRASAPNGFLSKQNERLLHTTHRSFRRAPARQQQRPWPGPARCTI